MCIQRSAQRPNWCRWICETKGKIVVSHRNQVTILLFALKTYWNDMLAKMKTQSSGTSWPTISTFSDALAILMWVLSSVHKRRNPGRGRKCYRFNYNFIKYAVGVVWSSWLTVKNKASLGCFPYFLNINSWKIPTAAVRNNDITRNTIPRGSISQNKLSTVTMVLNVNVLPMNQRHWLFSSDSNACSSCEGITSAWGFYV